MKIKNYIVLPMLALGLAVSTTSCKKDKDEEVPVTPVTPAMMTATYAYGFNNGEIIASASYDGTHSDELTASMKIDELSSTSTKITVTLNNTVMGASYNMHSHDAADPATTPNGTPYNETPNAAVFTQTVTGNGASVSISQTINMSYAALTTTYNGFFVVHDPLQALSTTDISTYLVLGTMARAQAASTLMGNEFDVPFNTGQVAAQYAYMGTHPTDFSAHVRLQELGNGTTRVSVHLHNAVVGQTYNIHSHDFADPATTPNGTPYDETPNSNVCVLSAMATTSMVNANQISTMSYSDLTTVYDGFFVVHDPLQALSTTDPTTYVSLAQFAR